MKREERTRDRPRNRVSDGWVALFLLVLVCLLVLFILDQTTRPDPTGFDFGLPSTVCVEEEIEREEKEGKGSRSFTISAQGINLPHIDKRHRGGEDAIFTSQDGHLLVVADGVGGWNLRGVDPSLYSRTLTQGVAEAFERGNRLALHLMCRGESKARGILGSSTLVVASIVGNKMSVGNIGDSGLYLIRNKRVVFKTTDLHHDFNFPFQLGASGDGLDFTELKEIEIKEGDIILLGSDGLFDNLFEGEILRLLFDPHETEDKAKYIANKAESISWTDDVLTPFEVEAASHGYDFPGGKMDDISVIVAFVLPL